MKISEVRERVSGVMYVPEVTAVTNRGRVVAYVVPLAWVKMGGHAAVGEVLQRAAPGSKNNRGER